MLVALSLPMTLALAVFFYRFIEVPMRRIVRNTFDKP